MKPQIRGVADLDISYQSINVIIYQIIVHLVYNKIETIKYHRGQSFNKFCTSVGM